MMSTDDFDLRLKHIEEQYGARREAADAYRDQELSKLFNECGWTQERIARRMRKNQGWVSYRLCFGRFLEFMTSGHNSRPESISAPTERSFRRHWAKTKDSDRERFAQVLSSPGRGETRDDGSSVLGATVVFVLRWFGV